MSANSRGSGYGGATRFDSLPIKRLPPATFPLSLYDLRAAPPPSTVTQAEDLSYQTLRVAAFPLPSPRIYKRRFPPGLLKKLNTDCLVMQNHRFFEVLTTSKDENNKDYVSTISSWNYPVTGFQWHPEKSKCFVGWYKQLYFLHKSYFARNQLRTSYFVQEPDANYRISTNQSWKLDTTGT
ncbi:hypothetical protein K1719_036808 [Acacia pycnantha]|nr:hypothetical protein K1719_036808 [Acacia pycnantha]